MNSWHQFDFMGGGGVEAAKHTPIMEAVCLSLIFYAKKIKIYPFFGHKKGEGRKPVLLHHSSISTLEKI